MPILIVNADDFGLSSGINRGIVKAHENGIVTSTSVMVRWPAAAEASNYARAYPRLSFGLHCDFGEWLFRDGEWEAAYEVVPLDDAAAVGEELNRQLALFSTITEKLPTHLDSHQHVHRREPVRSVMLQKSAELGIPLRLFGADIQYCGTFYGQTDDGTAIPGALSVDNLVQILRQLPSGVTELSCHPGDSTDFKNTYAAERANELEILCDPRVRRAIEVLGITVASFADVASNHGLRI